jgi:hypothetical protein
MKNSLFTGALVALFSLTPFSGHATVVMDLTGPELAAVADVIVHARVEKVSGHLDAQSRVFTDADLLVLDGLKGAEKNARLRMSFPGGSWQGLGMLVSGQVSLHEGREYLLYLHRTPAGHFIPAGMRLGQYVVEKRESDGVEMARMSSEGLTLVRKQKVHGAMRMVVSDERIVSKTLAAVLADIRRDILASRKLSRDAIVGSQR